MTSDRVSRVSELAEPTRRAIYEFIAADRKWVGREDIADAVGIGRAAAARHLDRLVEAELLDVKSERLTGRTGPGAGRPAKLYRRASREVGVSLPPRDYELAGEVLARAVESSASGGPDVNTAVRAEARAAGRRIGEDMERADTGSDRLATMLGVLTEHGYEPVVVNDHEIQLRNCPFHLLSHAHTDLVCGMNDALLSEMLETFEVPGFTARFEPAEDLCCVRLRRGDCCCATG